MPLLRLLTVSRPQQVLADENFTPLRAFWRAGSRDPPAEHAGGADERATRDSPRCAQRPPEPLWQAAKLAQLLKARPPARPPCTRSTVPAPRNPNARACCRPTPVQPTRARNAAGARRARAAHLLTSPSAHRLKTCAPADGGGARRGCATLSAALYTCFAELLLPSSPSLPALSQPAPASWARGPATLRGPI